MSVNYYVIGSKYQRRDGSYEDVFERMLEKCAVSVGWGGKHDLSGFHGREKADIIKYLQKKKEPPESCSVLSRFLNVKPGDLLAIKESGSPVRDQPRLIIRAYAVVIKRDGWVYTHDPDGLGHLISVDFLETYISKEFRLGYGRTIHHLRDEDRIKQIFGLYFQATKAQERAVHRKGVTEKNTGDQLRTPTVGSYIAKSAHNQLQQSVFNYLIELHGSENVKMEEDGVDIKLHEGKVTTFYEVKPYSTAKQCIREALGQLIQYSWFTSQNKANLRLAIVGSSRPTRDEIQYLRYIKSNFRIPIQYIAFDQSRLMGYPG